VVLVGREAFPSREKFHWHTTAFFSWMNCLNLKERFLKYFGNHWKIVL
jgi:hypothetical protein